MSESLLRTLGRGFLQILYPNTCWVCGRSIPPETRAFCSTCCEAIFTDPRPACPHCAATVGPFAAVANGCGTCKAEGFAFDAAVRIGPYDGALRQVILRLKHAHNEGLAEIVAGVWAERALGKLRALGLGSACVVPVPLHWWRRWQRGYNQSEALARSLAAALGVPCQPHSLRRVRATALQTQVQPSARRNNVRNAFEPRRSASLAGQTVLLVDDVMTTGNTAHEAARALRRGGASRVVVAVLARAEL